MAGLSGRAIQRRIKSMESTRQITKAMELVAASRLRQVQNRLPAALDHAQALRETLSLLASGRDGAFFPLRHSGDGRCLYLVIAADRGLAGGYNQRILNHCAETMPPDAVVFPIGKKAVDFCRSRGLSLYSGDDWDGDCFSLGARLWQDYRAGALEEIHLCRTRYLSPLTQEPVTERLLPQMPGPHREPLWEPDGETVCETVVPECLGGLLSAAILEAQCAEHSARRNAMDSASRNADERIEQFRLRYNQTRQAAITGQIIDLIAGSGS